jgi:phospholipase C
MTDPDDPKRRDFLKVSAAAASASLLPGCFDGGDDAPQPGVGAVDPLSRFSHLVVVMFENRSLDNLLGYLYPPGSPFDGLANGTHANPVPAFIGDGHASVVARPSPGTVADMQNPNPDPGEPFPRVNTQLFNRVDPPSNAFEGDLQMLPPYNAPPPGTAPTMQGFVTDYCNTFVSSQGRNPTFDEYRVIMDAFTPAQLPVLSTLAQQFAVYDAWHCSAPTQTLPNRSFFHASTSSGFVINQRYRKWIEQNGAPTIFTRLQAAGRTWRIYWDTSQIVPLTAFIHGLTLVPYFKSNFASMETFYADVANGTLPDYAFVEPRMLVNHNDFHPPGPLVVDGVPIPDPSDVRCGDKLIHDIYSAVKASASASGSNALNTLLLLTFDEHGGCYDHVPPPAATMPQNPQPAGEMGFFFDRLGVRVPTVAISAWTAAGTIVHRTVHHAAVVRSLSAKYGLAPLTDRDRDAPDLSDAINLQAPRPAATWPTTVPPPQPPGAGLTDALSPQLAPVPLNDLERHIVGLALAYFRGREPLESEIPRTTGEAYALLRPMVGDTFGP